jgi:uncharacterized protein YdaU (DUF1376 family)
MAEFPSMPLFTDAYIADTTHLSAEEHGAYMLLLICAWRSPHCRLPNNDKKLALMSRLTPAKWRKIKATILEFWKEEDDYIFQKKQREIFEKVENSVKQKRKAGNASAEAKALKRQEKGSTDVAPPLQRGANGKSTNQNQNQKESKQASKAGSLEYEKFGKEMLELAGIKSGASLTPVRLWLEAGISENTIRRTIEIKADSVRASGGAIGSLNYFDKAIQQAALEGKPESNAFHKKWSFDHADLEHWRRFLGGSGNAFSEQHRKNNWLIQEDPSAKLGPNPWNAQNLIIPDAIRDEYAAWNWKPAK